MVLLLGVVGLAKTEVWSAEEGSSLRMRRSTKRPAGEVRTIVDVGSEGGGLLVVEEEVGSQRMEWRIEISAWRSGVMVVLFIFCDNDRLLLQLLIESDSSLDDAWW